MAADKDSGVEIERHASGIVIVSVRGDLPGDDPAGLADALASAGEWADVLVDLSRCTSLDRSTVAVLTAAAQKLRERDGRLHVIVPETLSVDRAARMLGMGVFLSIHTTREAGLEGLS
jgi:anti-anti-sigma regulatory factor